MMMRWLTFYILFTKGIFRELERNTYDFLLCFALRFLLYSFPFCTDIAFDFLHWKMEQTEKKFWQAWKNFGQEIFGAFWKPGRLLRILAPNLCIWRKIGGLEDCLRQTFALNEK
jgi:hypothetical protein